MLPSNATFVPEKDAYVCWDNKSSTAQEVKRLFPDETVLLFNREKGTYTRFYIEITIPKPIIHNGRLVYEEGEVIEV